MTPVRLEPAALGSRVKHSTTKPLRSRFYLGKAYLSPDLFDDVSWECVAALADHFANAFVRKNVVRIYDVVATL